MSTQNNKPTEEQTSDVAGVVDDVTALNAAFPAHSERRQVPRALDAHWSPLVPGFL